MDRKKPIIAINFKAYKDAFGNASTKLLDKIESFAKEFDIETIVALPLTEIYKSEKYKHIKIYAQTAYGIDFGAYTGKIPTKALLYYGVRGVVVNHAEDQRTIKEIERILKEAYELNLEVLLCASSIESSMAFSYYKEVTYLAYEPPELIGTGKSVSEYRGDDIKYLSERIKINNPLLSFLVGAGISKRKDIDIALQLGAEGVFVASAIMKSENIEKTLEEFFAFW